MSRVSPRAADGLASVSLAVVVLGPLLFHRGYALVGDMVFVPHQPWKPAWLGLDGSVARFVPGDAVLSVSTAVLPGDLVQKALLLGALVLAGLGAARLVGDHGFVARLAVVVLFCWNPWVLERLSIGQWGAVVGYATLPYVVLAATAVRRDPRAGWGPLLLVLAFASLWSPAASLMATATAFCVVVVGRRSRPTLVTLGLSLLASLPWAGPSIFTTSAVTWADGQFDAFVARGESAAGLPPSLLSLGGIWKESIVPGERTVALIVVASCLSTVVGLVVAFRSRSGQGAEERATQDGLLLLALLSLLVAALPALPGMAEVLDAAAQHVFAVGLVRDSHRFLGPAVLCLLPGVAIAVDGILTRARSGPGALRAVAVLLAVWPAVCLPSMAWGLGGQLRTADYPAEWETVGALVDADVAERGGSTLVLPWTGGYRGFGWNDRRAVLDPAPRFFHGEVLIDDRLFLRGSRLDNESDRLAAVSAALVTEDPSRCRRDLGVARVLVHRDNGVRDQDVPEGEVLHDGKGLMLVSLGDPEPVAGPGAVGRGAVLVLDAILLMSCGLAGWTNRRRRGVG